MSGFIWLFCQMGLKIPIKHALSCLNFMSWVAHSLLSSTETKFITLICYFICPMKKYLLYAQYLLGTEDLIKV